MADEVMDTETRGEPATVDEGREPPAGSRGETGQKPDLSAATPIENLPNIDWECMSCGKTYNDAVTTCPSCGGLVRKIGEKADAVFAEARGPSHEDTAKTGGKNQESAENPADPSALGGNAESAKIEDLSARGETDSGPASAEDPKKPGVEAGGDTRLQGERVHEADKGSSGGGGGVGA